MSKRNVWRLGRLTLALMFLMASLAIQPQARLGGTAAVSLVPVAAAVSKQPPVYLARIYFNSLAERDQLASTLDAQETSTGGGYVTALVDDSQLATLRAAGKR